MKSLFLSLWLLIITGCGSNEKKVEDSTSETTPDLELISAQLDSIHMEDQKYRMLAQELGEKVGFEADTFQKVISKMMETDDSNTKFVTGVLDKYGWLGMDEIGRKANSTLFLVIQHADIEVQEKYLPMMRDAVEEGKARASSLALLEDRVSLRNGQPQIYGSQIGTHPETGEKYVLPLITPDSVDQRRMRMGLGPLRDYTLRFGFEWDVEAYKERLPEYLEIMEQEGR
jgi:hypothetical protein